MVRPEPERFELPDWLQWYMERYIGRAPRWDFPEIPGTGDLSFERLDFDNRNALLAMFADDPDPFVDPSYKQADKLYQYVAHNRICGPYSPKHGGADWIVRKSDHTPAGLVSAYDVSCETWALNHRRCTIGFAVRRSERGTGLAAAAVTTLQNYLFQTFDMLMLLAYTKRNNDRSVRFLRRLGYEEKTADYTEGDKNRFFELYRSQAAREQMSCRFEPQSETPDVV